MAATQLNCKLTNGVSFGRSYTITAADVTNGAINFIFQNPIPNYNLVAAFTVLTSAGTVVATTGAVITRLANGQVQIAQGTSSVLAIGNVIWITAQRDYTLTA